MRYFMFLDESGDANTRPDPRFNVFVLCGILFREDHYHAFDMALRDIKVKIFGNPEIVFHSYEMRKRVGQFRVLQDIQLQNRFYALLERLFQGHEYAVIACSINKEKYHERYPDKNQVYEDALMFICERSISYVGRRSKTDTIHFCLEKRGKKDRYLKKYYTSFHRYGTEYYSNEEFEMCNPELFFRGKDKHINGLEFADLCAFPIAYKELHPELPQPTYELFKDKFYKSQQGKVEGWGLKRFP